VRRGIAVDIGERRVLDLDPRDVELRAVVADHDAVRLPDVDAASEAPSTIESSMITSSHCTGYSP